MLNFQTSLDRDGFVKIPSFVSSSFVSVLQHSVDIAIETRCSPFFRDLSDDQDGSFLSDIWSSFFVSKFPVDYIPDQVPFLISTLMRCPSVILLQDTWFRRTSSCTVSIPWHHDQSIEGPFFSVWISLTDIPFGSSLRFVRGSHKTGLRYLPSSFFQTDSSNDEVNAMESFYREFHYSDSPDYQRHFVPIPPDLETNDCYDIVSVPTSSGDIIVFNGLTLHSLPSNKVDTCGFVLRWISVDSVVSPYSNDVQIASKFLNVSLNAGHPVNDNFFRKYDF